ncbi:MAG TPA: glycogen/starch/alpha-glucan phosphorylase [Blastocatellia bacterium]|nr:glycogen/starch/alpha-glucan phosphorylase [Blastocatellia bacterium]
MACETVTSSIDITSFQETICRYARYTLGKKVEELSDRDLFLAVTMAVRERLIDVMKETEERYREAGAKRLYYLSMEFLMGRSLDNNLYNLGIHDLCREALLSMGYDLDEVEAKEPDAALGNGGLGRLAACFLDSLATLGMPGCGYGINYEYGLFKQEIQNGYQKEKPDHWLEYGNPLEIHRPDEKCKVQVYGRIEYYQKPDGSYSSRWVDWKEVIGIPYDMPVVGFGGRTVNYLRLYTARSSHEFDMEIFNQGDYVKAVEQKIATETISKVLYPSDSVKAGKELRLLQEYFLVACAIKDIIRKYLNEHTGFEDFPSRVAIQLNDTHPSLAVVELMRTLLDEQGLEWNEAWEITQATLGYTNHTLLPEALERWPVSLFEHLLPRHLQIIQEIDRRFLARVSEAFPGDEARQKRMSIIDPAGERQVRMAHLAMVGSHSVNGVAALHSELIKTSLASDFYDLWPEKFNNKTNGVTQRRWLLKANPRLAALITRMIGPDWITELDRLRGLETYADAPQFQREFANIKLANKERLAGVIRNTTDLIVDPNSLFDIQVKRVHEYKRQLLNCMRIIHEYLCLVEDGKQPTVPRTYIFAGKAAPSYWAAKNIIKLINNLGEVINNDRRVDGLIKVVFIPDYRVSLAECIIPAADLSEQISTAGMEASGTGNMKFAMNGALTIGTLDGANIEIKEEVGEENIFIFGLKAEEIREMRAAHAYSPRAYYQSDPDLKRVMDALNSDLFCRDEPDLFDWIYHSILDNGDYYFHLADLPSYIEAQERVGREFNQADVWARKAILNVARVGKFSSDRTILEYAKDVWGIKSV